MTYESTATLEELATRIRAAKTIVCTSHEKPDGDAMGSVLALVRALSPAHEMHAWLMGSVPPPMQSMQGGTPCHNITGPDDIPAFEPDLVILLDTGAWSQVKPMSEWLRTRRG